MKYFFLITMFSITTSCASARKVPVLPFEKRIYVTCEKSQVNPPEGKLCFRQCVGRYLISKKCYDWFLDVIDLKDSHEKFYNWEMRIIK